MNVKSFFIDALSSALELGIATPEDVLKHVTPEILGTALPRPLWARLLTVCLGAPRVDAQLVVETIGVHNLCEHVPAPTLWRVIDEVGQRALSGFAPTSRGLSSAPTPLAVSAPPPPEARTAPSPPPPPPGPSIPAPGTTPDPDADDAHRMPVRSRTPTSNRFRNPSTGIGRLAPTNRRPQASAAVPDPAPASESSAPPKRRGETEVDVGVDTADAAGPSDWRSSLAVEDDQLVEWASSDETTTGGKS